MDPRKTVLKPIWRWEWDMVLRRLLKSMQTELWVRNSERQTFQAEGTICNGPEMIANLKCI